MNDFFVTWSRQRDAPLLPVERTSGDEMILRDGRTVYDFTSTSFQASFGHSHPGIVSAISRQLQRMPMASPKADFPLKRQATARLLARLGLPGKILFTVSGAESVENALKIARQQTQRAVIAARHKSYHGATLGAMSVSGDWRRDGHVNFDEGTLRIPEPQDDPLGDATRRLFEAFGPDRIAGLIVETVSGTNGVWTPPATWWQAIQQLCRDCGALLICDEVLVGFGRCSEDFAFKQSGVRPDLITMSKAISGGYIPFGAVWVSDPVAEYYEDEVFRGGLTQYAHPLGLAALNAVLDALDDRAFAVNKEALQREFTRSLQQLATTFSASALRQAGLLAAMEFGGRPLPPWTAWLDYGLYLFTKGDMLILAPPLVSSPERLHRAFGELERGLAALLPPRAATPAEPVLGGSSS